jgi:protein-tyrosine phosphatase
MFSALLAHDLEAIGAPCTVASAGILEWDQPADPAAVTAMIGFGLDLSGHRSRPISSLDLAAFDLILTMTREHVREIVIGDPDLFPVTFTAKAFARALAGPQKVDRPEGISERIRALSAGRPASSMLGQSTADDVADPYRLGQQQFNISAAELAELSRNISLGLHALSH